MVLDDLESVAVRTVVSGGDVVVEDGDPLVGPREHEYPDAFTDSARVDASPEAFRVAADAATDGRVRAIEYRQGLLSAETAVEPRMEDGELHAAPENDVLKATLLDRHPDGDGTGFTGFLTGFGMDEGAVASTIIWETPGVLAVGTDDADMQAAVDRVEAMGGGWAVVHDGDLRVDLPAPFGGFCAVGDVEETVERYDAVEAALRDLGASVERPMLALQTLTFTGVPTLKLSFSGYADILAQRTVGLALD
ncbi:adenine deaminase C-terminal domain-containing protein [Halobacteriaceae archaeon GCM10025711]